MEGLFYLSNICARTHQAGASVWDAVEIMKKEEDAADAKENKRKSAAKRPGVPTDGEDVEEEKQLGRGQYLDQYKDVQVQGTMSIFPGIMGAIDPKTEGGGFT